jgi:hypothetical protein
MQFLCVADLNQLNYLNSGNKLLDLAFPNFVDISADLSEYIVNQPDRFHLLFIADSSIQIKSSKKFSIDVFLGSAGSVQRTVYFTV